MTKENEVEQAAIHWLKTLDYTHIRGPELTPERKATTEVLLEARLRNTLHRLNPHLEEDTLDHVARTVTRPAPPSLEETNAEFHRWLLTGFEVEQRHQDGTLRGDLATLVNLELAEARAELELLKARERLQGT